MGKDLKNSDISISVSGIGKARSLRWLEKQNFKEIKNLLIVGFGGALDETLKLGQVTIGTQIMANNTPLTSLEPFGKNLLSDLKAKKIMPAQIYTSVTPVLRPARRKKLNQLGVNVVDMESWWLIENLPPKLRKRTGVVRVISDTPDSKISSLKDNMEVASQALSNFGKILNKAKN